MKNLILLVSALLLGSCSLMPSKWDVNQARVIVNVRLETNGIGCNKDPTDSITTIQNDLNWLHQYSQYKGTIDLDKMNFKQML